MRFRDNAPGRDCLAPTKLKTMFEPPKQWPAKQTHSTRRALALGTFPPRPFLVLQGASVIVRVGPTIVPTAVWQSGARVVLLVMLPHRASGIAVALTLAAVAAAVGVGLVLRLADPLSSPVVPAEDPYTHMALVREHLRTGHLDGLNDYSLLYPPGLHGFVAAWVSFTGMDLYESFRLGPALLGAIGVLGFAILLWRHQGMAAGIVGAMAVAVAPETIFRTTMMSPTAIDLAILPFLLLAIVELLRGRLGWTPIAAALALFTMFAHPWLLAILAASGVAFALLWLVAPWGPRRPALSLQGLAATMAVLGGSLGLAFTTCGGDCGPGFRDMIPITAGQGNLIALGLLAVSLAPAALLAFGPAKLRSNRVLERREPHLAVRAGVSAALAATLAFVTAAAVKAGIPELVDLPRMFGWPILVLAFAAVVLLPFLASPVSNLAASLFAITYPFTVFNPLNSPFWPHRTAVYLGVALVILAGCAGAGLVRLVTWIAAWLHAAVASRSRPRAARPTDLPLAALAPSRPSGPARPYFGLLAVGILATLALAGTVYAQTPDDYSGGWYRLYQPCEMDALQAIAERANANPHMVVITGDWESKLVLASFIDDSTRVWYKDATYAPGHGTYDLKAIVKDGRSITVVTDRYLKVETPDADTTFLQGPEWTQITAACTSTATGQPLVASYAFQGA